MRVNDFWIEDDLDAGGRGNFNLALAQSLRRAPVKGVPDIEAAIALARLLHDEFQRYGTDSSNQLADDESREGMRALVTVADRLGVAFEPPYRDLTGFRAYWGANHGRGSWESRRVMLHELFEPLHQELERREDDALKGELAEPISPRKATGWAHVDIEIAELRRHFHGAKTQQDYRNIGNDVVMVLERLSEAAYEPSRHLRIGEIEPPVAQTKNRLTRIVETDFPGEGSDELVKLAKTTVDLAQAIKHNAAGSRVRAGIAADAVIQLANMIRRMQAGS